jgi:hypothetical protein
MPEGSEEEAGSEESTTDTSVGEKS